MGFERVGGYRHVVTPDLLEQPVARHRLLIGAEEMLYDGCFFLRERNLVGSVINQKLLAWLESVRSDLERRIIGMLELTQLRADAGKKHCNVT